jgi:hypothetical protein
MRVSWPENPLGRKSRSLSNRCYSSHNGFNQKGLYIAAVGSPFCNLSGVIVSAHSEAFWQRAVRTPLLCKYQYYTMKLTDSSMESKPSFFFR